MPAPMVSRRNGHQNRQDPSKPARTTLILPTMLDRNLEAYCLREGYLKTEVVTAAISQFLKRKGIQPDRPPKLSW